VLPEVISPFAARAEIEDLASGLTMRDIIEREQSAGIQFGPVHRQFQLEAAPEKVQRLLEKSRRHPEIVAINQAITGAEQRLFPPANLRAAINTTTTETNLWDPSLWALIPALTMRAGMRYKVSFGGVFGTTGTPTIVWAARCGTNNSAPPTGTTLGASPTVTLGTVTAQPFYGEFTMGVRSIGVAAAGASVTGNGIAFHCGAAAATVSPVVVFGGAVPATIDDTIAQGLACSIIWSASSASNTLTPQWMSFESL
jgi:hypothetical protein